MGRGAPTAPDRERIGLTRGLPFRLLVLTIAFVMLAEVLIFAPSVARYRLSWMEARLADGHIAALSLLATPDGMVTKELERTLLGHARAITVDLTLPGSRTYMLMAADPPAAEEVFDLDRAMAPTLIMDAFDLLLRRDDRVIKIVGASPKDDGAHVEVLVREAPLRAEMLEFAERILWLSIVISLITAGLVYLSLNALLVRPIRRIVSSMMAFRSDPENPGAIVPATRRRDEVGLAQQELADLQIALRAALRQQQRLAALGTAVTKIHHDLGGILSTAALVSERLATSEDPEVRRLAPRLLEAIDRAADLSAQTLAYSRDGVLPLTRSPVDVESLAGEIGAELVDWSGRFGRREPVAWSVKVPSGFLVVADAAQLRRALTNLGRNAIQAGARSVTVTADALPEGLAVTLTDDGPGLPEKARDNLFTPFAGSARPGGHGLGLAIAREVMRSHGGDLELVRSDASGTVFRLLFPRD